MIISPTKHQQRKLLRRWRKRARAKAAREAKRKQSLPKIAIKVVKRSS